MKGFLVIVVMLVVMVLIFAAAQHGAAPEHTFWETVFSFAQ